LGFVENLILVLTVQKLGKLVQNLTLKNHRHRLCNVLFLWTTVCLNCSLSFAVYNTEMFGVQIIVAVDKVPQGCVTN